MLSLDNDDCAILAPMATPAVSPLPPTPVDNSPSAARARGEALLRDLERQGIPREALDEELSPEDTAAVLAWMRGEAPCPSID